jgi:hypothetical protein
MPGRKIKITDEQRRMLSAAGYTPVEMQVAGVRKVTLYKKSGGEWQPNPNMPGDPGSIQKYLSRGFLLAPPGSATTEHPDYVVSDPSASVPKPVGASQGVKEAPAPGTGPLGEFNCDVCGDKAKAFTSMVGLKTHRRKSKIHKSIVKATTQGLVGVA